MTIQANPELLALLSPAASKTAWLAALKTALGGTRRLVCTHNGTVFRDCTLTGTMTDDGSALTGLGYTSDATVSLAANLASGTATLRIEGNGHWIEGSLGLTGSGKDFILSGNPTENNGLALSAVSISAPAALPVNDPAAPYDLILQDWTTGSPVDVGTMVFDTQGTPLTFEDAEVAADMGEVAVTHTGEALVFGQFAFGAIRLEMAASKNAEDNAPLFQVLIACKPHGTWATYPALDTYNIAEDLTIPPAFKVVMRKQDGTILHTFEQRDGLPINSPLLSQVRDADNPLRPLFNCARLLAWESHKPVMANNASRYFNGMTADSIRPTLAKLGSSFNAVIPALNMNSANNLNALQHYYALPQWPLSSALTAENNAADASSDPYLFNIQGYASGSNPNTQRASRATGWDYEVSSFSGHDRFTGPGGPRSDRAVVPSIVALYMSDPDGVMLKDGTTYRQRVDAWNKAYFNHAHHFIRDVTTFDTLPVNEVILGQWAHTATYYGNTTNYVTGGASRHVSLHALSASSSTPKPADKNGNLQWGGDAIDYEHNYSSPAWGALLFNSPAHVVANRHRVMASWMAQLLLTNLTADCKQFFLIRTMAWRWLHSVTAWKLASTHPTLGIPRALVEQRFQNELEQLHAQIYVPATDPEHASYNTPYFKALRELGIPRSSTPKLIPGDLQYYTVQSSALTFYIGHVLVLMKTTGMWETMQAKSAQCATMLDYLISRLDLYAFDFILDTNGRAETTDGRYTRLSPIVAVGETIPDTTPASWAEWASTTQPATGSEDWLRDSDGSMLATERDVAQHLRAQYAFARRDYFSEIANPRMEAACALYESFYADRKAHMELASTPADKAIADFNYLYPSLGRLNPLPE